MKTINHQAIDDVIHGRVRLSIMSFLMGAEQSDFVELKETLGLTDGNLGAQLRKLESNQYVKLKKGYLGRKTRMTVTLTDNGRAAMHSYLEMMKKVLDQ